MKKIAAVALVVIMVMCVFVACGEKGIVGKWEASFMGIPMTMEFTADGTLTMDVMGESESGKYKYEDNKIYFSYDGEDWEEDALEVKSLKGNEMVIEIEGMELTFKRK